MARIVAAMAMTHSPGLTGWFDRAPQSHQTQALQAMTEMRERLIGAISKLGERCRRDRGC